MQVKTILYNESTSVVLILRLFALSPDRPPRGRDMAAGHASPRRRHLHSIVERRASYGDICAAIVAAVVQPRAPAVGGRRINRIC